MIVFFITAEASFAQERIFLHEQIRFATKRNHLLYLIPHVYRITSNKNPVPISRLCLALEAVVTKHRILRTAIYFSCNGRIMQRCLGLNKTDKDIGFDGFSVVHFHSEDKQDLPITITDIMHHPDLFDISKGWVIQCHVLRQHQPTDDTCPENCDLLIKDDVIMFSIHHSTFDGASKAIFFDDLALAYKNDGSLPIDENELQYIDYAVHERLLDTTISRAFWHTELEGYNAQGPLALPFDRQRPPTNQRSDFGLTAGAVLNDDISTAILNYASAHHVTLFQLGLAAFYAFLFKLTHGQTDLCVSSLSSNRYRPELQNMIGMFVATLPYRMKLDPHQPFADLVEHVRTKSSQILGHSSYSLQNILADLQLNQSNASFLETVFDFSVITTSVGRFSLGDTESERIFIKQSLQVAKFDFTLSFAYNCTLENNHLAFSMVCSRDIFDYTTVGRMAERFEYFLGQLFGMRSGINKKTGNELPLSKLSIILPEEAAEMDPIIFCRIDTPENEGTGINIKLRLITILNLVYSSTSILCTNSRLDQSQLST